MKIDVLGTEYTITEATAEEDKYLESCDGYCDKSSKKIGIRTEDESCELEDFEAYKKKVLRHEIIHAFLFESGIWENYQSARMFGHDEVMVDWFAVQFPKIMKVYKEVGCIES